MTDSFGRDINYLRISLTDRCNLRCLYCMGKDGIRLMSMKNIVTYEELLRIVRITASLGISKIKVTGGEPLVRKGALSFIAQLKQVRGIEQVTLTTNGILLAECAAELAQAGIDGVNVSIDRTDAESFSAITRGGDVNAVLAGLDAAFAAGITNIKTNTVLVRELKGDTEDTLHNIILLAKTRPIHVRFIELMPLSGANGLIAIPAEEVKHRIETYFGQLKPLPSYKPGNGPASYYSLQGFAGKIGFIPVLGASFCASCSRIRLTADGFLKTCLYYSSNDDIKSLLRDGADDAQISKTILTAIQNKPERHHFGSTATNEHTECRKMFSIGG